MRYNPDLCDLCNHNKYSVLLDFSTCRAMCSDLQITSNNLIKVVCEKCGLVRSGSHFDSNELMDFYINDYLLSVKQEHYFYSSKGLVARSKLICDWLISSMGKHRWEKASRCLEIGAGSGRLLKELSRRFPNIIFEGIELSKNAALLARNNGISVYSSFDDLESKDFNIIFAVGVIEHVSSPTNFLNRIYNMLEPKGWLFLCNPTQNVLSYDIFFYDHLFHFGIEHLRQYARKCGFYEWGFVIGHELMPNFSVHLFKKVKKFNKKFKWIGPPGYTMCKKIVYNIVNDIARLNSLLEKLALKNRRVAVFGLQEVYWLLRAYSALDKYQIICGLDDNPNNPDFKKLEFPIIIPEECTSLGVQDVLLTMNKIYYKMASKRIESLGLIVHPVLS